MVDLSFSEIKKRLDNFSLPETDLVIGIAEGGLVPASLAANKLGVELKIIKLNYRDEFNTPIYDIPRILSDITENIKDKRILLVDDVSVSGKTLEIAKTLLSENIVNTFVMKGKGDFVLFPEINQCVNWPWKIQLAEQK